MGEFIVVFDTVVFVRALINPHSFWGRLVFEHSHEYWLFLTPQTLREYVEVLQRPELTSKFTAFKDIDVARFPEIFQQAEVVTPKREPQVSRDVNKNKFLAAAEAAHAAYLVSEDRDLLDLTEHEDTRIITAYEFLQILETHRKAA